MLILTTHCLLRAELKCRIARINNKRTIRIYSKYDRDRKNIPEVKQEYANKRITHVEEMDKSNINWQILQQIITETADEIVGKVNRTEINKWYEDECEEATRNNEAYRSMIQNITQEELKNSIRK
jgi:hypothetical protein